VRQAQLADGTILEFPDETPDAVMDATVKREITRGGAPVSEFRAAPPPPTFLEGMGQGAVDVAKRWGPEILPIAGMVSGGILGGTAGAAGGPLAPATVPGGAAIGAGIGYAGGRQANTAIESFINYLRGAPQSAEGNAGILETAGRIGKDALTGAAIEAGGQSVGVFGGKLAEILRDAGMPGFGAAPGLAAVNAAAARSGIDMPASASTGSRTLAAVEATPGRFPIGAQQGRDFFDRASLSMQRAGERMVQGAGPDVGLETAGRAIQRDVGAVGAAQDEALAGLRAVHAGDLASRAEQVGVRDQGFVQGQQAEAEGLIDQFLRQFGAGRAMGPNGELSGTQLGTEIQAALNAAQNEARGRIAPLYQGLREEVSAAGSHVPMTATKEAADRILEFEQRMTGLGRSNVSRPAGAASGISSGPIPEEVAALPATMQESIIRQLGLDQGRAIEPDIALELSKRLQAAARNAPDDITRRAINDLRSAVEQDVTAWANVSGTNVGPMRAQAAQAYREEIVPYFSESAPMRKQLMDVEPEVAGQRLLSLRDPQLIQDAMRFLPPEVQNRIRASVLSGLPRDAAGFQQAAGRYSDDALTALLGPEQAAALGQVRRQLEQGQGRLESNRAFGSAIGATDAQAAQAAFDQRMQAGFGPQTIEPQLAAFANKEGSVETLVNSLTKGRYRSLEDFDATWQAISPETQQQVSATSLHRLYNEAFDQQSGHFSTQRFLSRWAEVPDAIWQRMLPPDRYAQLRDLTTVMQQVTDYSRGAANPSQTGLTVLGASQIAALGHLAWSTVTGQQDPATFSAELAAITAPAWGGKLLFSKGAQNFLKRPSGQGSGAYAPLSRVLGIELTQ
jgi:hypothetical protein